MAPEKPRERTETDPWKEFEGIPLCHVPAGEEEARDLAKKGVCGPLC